ncbi:MAG: CDP-alcohol phosphatidyltransferase family protein [Deltaproteobacteria bacterium]|nr:CDP-alcohol phosphatidyltransferase family protein [Deltaproteobacteria bacterium]
MRELINLPNLLTGSRVILGGVFLFFVLQDVWPTAFWIFLVAAATDLIDGAVARLFDQKTQAGAILDGAADKILMSLGFVSLTAKGWLPLWLTVFVLLKDLMVTGGIVYFRIKKVALTYHASILSKSATFFQILTLSFALLNASFGVGDFVYGYDRLLAGLLTAMATIQYFYMGLGILRESQCAR